MAYMSIVYTIPRLLSIVYLPFSYCDLFSIYSQSNHGSTCFDGPSEGKTILLNTESPPFTALHTPQPLSFLFFIDLIWLSLFRPLRTDLFFSKSTSLSYTLFLCPQEPVCQHLFSICITLPPNPTKIDVLVSKTLFHPAVYLIHNLSSMM